jgi:hypothetical protein
MRDVVLGLLAVVVGTAFALRGYLAMRVMIPIWGAFSGFLLGAGLVSSVADERFLASVLSWLVGLVLALLFGAVAYFYYEVSVVIAMSAIGFSLGTAVMVAIGVNWSWLITVVAVVVGVLLAVVAIRSDLPMALLTVLTALSGASTVVFGLMLLFGVVSSADLKSATTTQRLEDDWWWYAIFLAVAVFGAGAQFATTAELRASIRESWKASGGREIKTKV